MTDDREPEPTAREADPWAPGGAMSRAPIPPPPELFGPTPPAPARPTGPEPDAGPVPARGTRVAVAVAVVTAMVLAGTWLLRRDRDAAQPVAEPTTTTVATATTAPSTEPPVTTGADAAGDGASGDGGSTAVEVPPPLASMMPTELVLLTADGAVVEIDLAGGTAETVVRSVALPSPTLASAGNSAVVWSPGDGVIVVVRRDLPPVFVEVGVPLGGVVAEYDDEFLLQPLAGSGEVRELRLDQVVRTAPFGFGDEELRSARPHPSGEVMVPGDDGTYLLAIDGPRRISSGSVVAQGPRHVLYRVCEGEAGCSLVRADATDGVETTLPAAAADEVEAGRSPYVLSPDGAALVGPVFGPAGPVLRIIELDDGPSVDVPVEANAIPPTLAWAPDSSGFFVGLDGTVAFVERATGNTIFLTAIAEAVGPVIDLAARAAEVSEVPVVADSLVVRLTGLTGLDLAALGRDGDVILVDVDGRTYFTHDGGSIGSGAPAYMSADADRVNVVSWDNVPGFRLDFGSEPVPLDNREPSGKLYPGPLPHTYWSGVGEGIVDFDELALVDAGGEPVGQTITLVDGAFPIGSDGTGHVLVAAPGGHYVAHPDGARRLTSGFVFALGPTTAYARECDETLVCGVVRIDRATGARQPVTTDQLDRPATDPFLLATFGNTVSPDGDVVFARVSENSLAWKIVDVAAGTSIEVPGPGSQTPLVWSDDSQYAAYVSGDRLRIYDRAAGRLVELAQLPPIKTFAEVAPDVAPPTEIPF